MMDIQYKQTMKRNQWLKRIERKFTGHEEVCGAVKKSYLYCCIIGAMQLMCVA